MSVQMIVGDYPFSISGVEYSQLRRVQNWRWAERERLNRKPALQYQGPGARRVTLIGTIHVQTTRQLEQPQQMRAIADSGEPLNVLASNDTLKATYHGRWVITDLAFDETDLQGNGTPETIGFEMTLQEYGEDGDV